MKSRTLLLFVWLAFGVAPMPLSVATLQAQNADKESAPDPEPLPPVVAAASMEGEQAMQGFRLPAGISVRLFAAEPLIANPVAFSIDSQGRFLVCESFRQNQGVTDNRGHDTVWLEHDLAAQTVDDRLAYHKKLLPEGGRAYAEHDDRIRVLEDRDGDGKADHSTVFADHFNQIIDGTGAGVLQVGDSVYYTCIPHLWRLRDTDGDGRADQRESLLRGLGVRVAFRGHDAHGLIQGPDGRLYFSIGDRGYHIVTPDGTLANPESGAVFRCNLDGSQLEVVALGLRNPQELAFDEYGNLFTGDNNSDSGDKARWVYVVPGSDSGWRMAYQYLSDRGPFNREQLWHPFHDGQAAYIVPPIDNLADGPSGLAYDPGTGLPDHFRRRFYLCDFRGGPANSGIRTFRVQPQGAFFKLADQEESIWSILATDVAIGPDGALYASDWVNGWNGEGKGRLYRFAGPPAEPGDPRLEVQAMLRDQLQGRTPAQLGALLAHPDQRIRQRAQFALVEGRHFAVLDHGVREGETLLARLHALWGLGQLTRNPAADAPASDATTGSTPAPEVAQALTTLTSLLGDPEPEIRGQAATVLAEAGHRAAIEPIVELLSDSEPRVRYFAAQASGKFGAQTAFEPLLALAEENEDRDPILRHGAIMGLAGCGHPQLVERTLQHPSRSVRLAAVVALRKLNDSQVARFLNDADPLVVLEAARAIHDVPLPEGLPALAELIVRPTESDPLLRRVLNANFRLGKPENAVQLARFAGRPDAPEAMRVEALAMLADWGQPSSRDRVLGMWRPLSERSVEPVVAGVRAALPGILSGPDKVREAGGALAADRGIREVGPALRSAVTDAARSGASRAAALRALETLRDEQLQKLLAFSLNDSEPQLRMAACRILAGTRPQEALPRLRESLQAKDRFERQQALEILAGMPQQDATDLIHDTASRLLDGQLPADMRLDALLAAQRKADAPRITRLLDAYKASLAADDPLAAYQVCLEGGDAQRGERIFLERTQVSCLRCHKVKGRGGEVGPELTKVAADKQRAYLLEAVVQPSKAIAKGFETAKIADDTGKVHVGIVKEENEQVVRLMTAEGRIITLQKDAIEERLPGKSAMPEDLLKHLSLSDVRDLVEYLSGLK
jgi:quinoprotein glucose dehydrogenase